MRRPPLQTVRADFPHTASLVKLVSLVSFPYPFRASFALIPTDAPLLDKRFPTRRRKADCPLWRVFRPILFLAVSFASFPFTSRGPSLHGHYPLRRYYDLVRLLRPLSRCRPPKFPTELSEHAAPLYPAMFSVLQIESGTSFRLHAE